MTILKIGRSSLLQQNLMAMHYVGGMELLVLEKKMESCPLLHGTP
jgi:hypothetical protein